MDSWGEGRKIGGWDYGEDERGYILWYGKRGMPWRYEDTKEEGFYWVREGIIGDGWIGFEIQARKGGVSQSKLVTQ